MMGQKIAGTQDEKRITLYSSLHQILLVGEGDFSFSSCLATAFTSATNILATSLDTYAQLVKKYCWVQNNLSNLLLRGAVTLHNVDARTLVANSFFGSKRFDRIIFNFPHAGFFGQRETDQDVIEKHKELMRHFFLNSSKLLMEKGEIHVLHKSFDPYTKWDLEALAKTSDLTLKSTPEFNRKDYPGYVNRRGDGSHLSRSFVLGSCKTYVFGHMSSVSVILDAEEYKRTKRKRKRNGGGKANKSKVLKSD